MAPAVSVVLVHYRAGRLAARAVAAVHADLAAAGLAGEVLVVDNGGDDDDRAALAGLPARLLDPGENLGFAGGVDLGAAEARGETLVLMNPDVLVLPGCLGALAAELAAGADVAGPRFWWDSGRRVLLPPAEARGRLDELLAALAAGGGRWQRIARARWRRHARRHWRAERPLASFALSGALLAVRRAAWERVGPFDTAYRLYFEETDWLARAAGRGLVARYVPAAEAVHLHGESARREPRAAAWFEESARRFRRRHLGRATAAVVERLAAAAGRRAEGRAARVPAAGGGAGTGSGATSGAASAELAAAATVPAAEIDLRPWLAAGPLWVEVSPLERGFPAGAERLAPPLAARWSLPAEVRSRVDAPLVARLVADSGRELARFVLDASLAGAA